MGVIKEFKTLVNQAIENAKEDASLIKLFKELPLEQKRKIMASI